MSRLARVLGGVGAVGSLTLGALASGYSVSPSEAQPLAQPVAHENFGSPLVLAHRGASGYRPEHTAAAYDLAVAQGADYIEPDLVMTKDGVLVDRHEPEIGGTTDVAAHPEFADRRTTKILDGVSTTGWFSEDFTLAELKTLRAKERLPQIRQENTIFDGRYSVTTFEEDLQQREALSRKYHRTVGIIPEIKHSTYFHAHGLNPEAAFMKLVNKYGLNKRNAPLWLQSFELGNLLEVRTAYGYRAQSVFLATNGGAPYDLVAKGDGRNYANLLAPQSLKNLSRWIDGIGPDKGLVIARNSDGTLGATTPLVADAHAAGLLVTPYTFRAENTFLPTDYRIGSNPADYGRAIDEDLAFMRAGVDGLFCDQPDICVEARSEFHDQPTTAGRG